MVTNKTEKMISKSIAADNNLWGMKLHNNPMAHQTTPADYIISYEDAGLRLVLLEAKQVTLKIDGKGRLTHKRLKQMGDMIGFQNQSIYHKSYFIITYKDRMWANSEIYIIPVLEMKSAMEHHNNVSFNRADANAYFNKYKVNIQPGSIIDIRGNIYK